MAGVHITKQDAKVAVHRLESIKRRIAGIKERAEETTERLVQTAETAGAAFAVGVLQGKTGGVDLFGVPIELGLGLGLNAFALLGGAGKASSHLNNIGNGCLAAYATTLGRGVGVSWQNKATTTQQVTAPKVSGLAPGGAPSAMDMAMAQAAMGLPVTG